MPFILPKPECGLVYFPPFQQSTEILSSTDQTSGIDPAYIQQTGPAYIVYRWPIDPDGESAISGIPDDDQARLSVLALSRAFVYVQPWAFGESFVVRTREEQDWQNPLIRNERLFGYPQQFSFDTQDSFASPVEEDYWQNPLQRLERVYLYPFQASYDEQTPTVTSDDGSTRQSIVSLRTGLVYPQPFAFGESAIAITALDNDQLVTKVLAIRSSIITRVEPWSFDVQYIRGVIPENEWTNLVLPVGFNIHGLNQWPMEQMESGYNLKPTRLMYVTRMTEVLNLENFPEKG